MVHREPRPSLAQATTTSTTTTTTTSTTLLLLLTYGVSRRDRICLWPCRSTGRQSRQIDDWVLDPGWSGSPGKVFLRMVLGFLRIVLDFLRCS